MRSATLGPGPADDQAPEFRHEPLQVHVPEPGEVLPVDGRVAVRGQQVLSARALEDHPESFVVRRGVLDERQYRLVAARLYLFEASERRTQPGESRLGAAGL